MHDWQKRLATPRFIGYVLFVGVVAGVAAINSYWHQVTVALLAHQPTVLAHTIPLAVDGMLGVATLAIADDKALNRKIRPWARFGFWFGAALSVAANVASVVVEYGLDPLSIGGAAAAPVLLLVVVEIISKPGEPIKNPNRVEGAKRGHQNRKPAQKSTKPRTRRVQNTPINKAEPATQPQAPNAEVR